MSFTLELSKFGAAALLNANLVIQKVTMDIFDRVIMKTPVDTGRARANWLASKGTMITRTIEETDRGTVASNRAQSVASKAKAGDVIYLSNNLPYIGTLENGSSNQAPQGMVKTTLAEFQGIVKEKA